MHYRMDITTYGMAFGEPVEGTGWIRFEFNHQTIDLSIFIFN